MERLMDVELPPASGRPIGDYALLSDRHSAALVARDGSVDWLCFPRFDSRSVCAALLDQRAGHWLVRPSGEAQVTRRYVPGTLVLETTFRTASGTGILRDALLLAPPRRSRLFSPRLASDHGHHLGKDAPHVLARSLECTAGELEVELEFLPRTEYGLTTPIVVGCAGGVRSRGGPDELVMSSPDLSLTHGDGFARGAAKLRAGASLAFALQWHPAMTEPPSTWSHQRISAALSETIGAWQRWDELHRGYDGPYAEQVALGSRVLKGLGYEPTGAIVAAATTSLPEAIGGSRNWDYRFSWIRDASLTLQAMWVSACPHESGRFFSWAVNAAGAVAKGGTPIQIMYGIGG
ncbi:MAG: glycoside hydrolase family 15 protein, partial [Chloroflexota bacterium]|nr:glycoside hydrolase family 15 protein [Chloroflexota bacterium]